MELGGCLQQELEPEQLWLDIAGECYDSSFEFEGFVLDIEKKSPRQELAVREEDSLLKRNWISAPPGVTVALDQNRSSLISVLPGAMVQDQMQASLTEVRN